MNRSPIGSLDARVEIQTLSEVESGTSDTQSTWTTIATVWANIKPVQGLVALDTKNIGQGITHKIVIRTRDITSEFWIKYQDKRYRVRGVTADKRFTELLCEYDSNASD
jgi:SPP1 family predicted phage head-tail adaptor